MLKIDRKRILQRLRRVHAAELRRQSYVPKRMLAKAAQRAQADLEAARHELAKIRKGELSSEYAHLRRLKLLQIEDAINILEVATSNEIDVHRTPFTRIVHLFSLK